MSADRRLPDDPLGFIQRCLRERKVYARPAGDPFHALFAVDVEGNNIRVVTAYHPNLDEWEPDLRTRRAKP